MAYEDELREQKRWHLLARWSHVPWFDKSVGREFLTPAEQRALQGDALRRMAVFAARHVPHYREVFARLGLSPAEMSDPSSLVSLPVLRRSDIGARPERFRPDRMPEGFAVTHFSKTSGSTGEPVKVYKTHVQDAQWAKFMQREARWFRFNPLGALGMIRDPESLPGLPEGKSVPDDGVCQRPAWPSIGSFFETGPFVGCSVLCSISRQADWLEEHRPDYLVAQASALEHLAFECAARPTVPGVQALHAIAQELTPSMRSHVERVFRAPVHQNYGLNEIGLVASRCPEGGRYHVHAESSIVEIVDEEGRPCQPGQRGRILISAITNPAMPLFRYDSGDIAECTEEPCPCGRTLPSFGSIMGRYRRMAFLPPETVPRFMRVHRALSTLPQTAGHIRQYQLHQFRDGSFELRVVAAEGLTPAFEAHMEQAWRDASDPSCPPLRIVRVDEIPLPPSGKFENFTSDFFPQRDT